MFIVPKLPIACVCQCGDHTFRLLPPYHVLLHSASDQAAIADKRIQVARLRGKSAIARNGENSLAAQVYDHAPIPVDLAASFGRTNLQTAMRKPLRTVIFGEKAAVVEFVNGNPLDLRRDNVVLRVKRPRDYLPPKLTPTAAMEAKRERSRNRPSKLRAKAARVARKAKNQALHALKNQPRVVLAFLTGRAKGCAARKAQLHFTSCV